VRLALEQPSNRDVLANWIRKWEPLADEAIKVYCAALPDAGDASARAVEAARQFRQGLGI
jgi:toluene monooxygenase system protein E